MDKRIRKPVAAHEPERISRGELIHQHVRLAIETAVHEELRAALGTSPYECTEVRRGYRKGTKARTLTVVATYLAGGNTHRIRGALQPLLKAAPLPKSAVSREVATLKDGLEAWRPRSLADVDVIYVYLDGFALRVRSAGKVVSVPVLGVNGVLPDGHKHLLALELCGSESSSAWKGCLGDLVAHGLRAPLLAIIDGHAGLRRAVELVWPKAAVQHCCVHKRRNLERKAPKHALAEIRDHLHRIVYAANADAARAAFTAFERAWTKGCPGVVTSLRGGGGELLTFFNFPTAQWKTLRTTKNSSGAGKRKARCPPKTQLWSCSLAWWQAGRLSCAGSTGGGRSPRRSASARRWRHDPGLRKSAV